MTNLKALRRFECSAVLACYGPLSYAGSIIGLLGIASPALRRRGGFGNATIVNDTGHPEGRGAGGSRLTTQAQRPGTLGLRTTNNFMEQPKDAMPGSLQRMVRPPNYEN